MCKYNDFLIDEDKHFLIVHFNTDNNYLDSQYFKYSQSYQVEIFNDSNL